jgi:hypothetical protein
MMPLKIKNNTTTLLHNFIRIHDRKNKEFKWDKHNFNDDARSNSQENIDNKHDEEMKVGL